MSIICKKYNSRNPGNNYNKEKTYIPEDKAIEYYFSANSADHSLTQYHILFHTLLLLVITSLDSNCQKIIISVLGFISSIFSLLTLKRGDSFTNYWKNKMEPGLREEMDDSLLYKDSMFLCIIENSRFFTMIIISVVYFIIFCFSCIEK